MTVPTTQVLVVGAGPIGITLGCELRRLGVDRRIVERLPAVHTRPVTRRPRQVHTSVPTKRSHYPHPQRLPRSTPSEEP